MKKQTKNKMVNKRPVKSNMEYKYSNLKIKLTQKDDFKKLLIKKLNIKIEELKDIKIIKRTVDARHEEIVFNYTCAFKIANPKVKDKILRNKNVMPIKKEIAAKAYEKTEDLPEVAIIGFGPAGLYAALTLSEQGFPVTVYERGGNIEERAQAIEDLTQKNILNPESNIQFGVGGAGTYSDGKLTSRSKDPRSHKVLEYFVEAGADKSILYDTYPHLGSDKLREYLVYFIETLTQRGVNLKFNQKLTDLTIAEGKVSEFKINDKPEKAEIVILAIGHSARDTYEMLNEKGIELEAKEYALGVRIEHPQNLIDYNQYKTKENIELLGHASYKLRAKIDDTHSVYSFCMCPGGLVVNASSEKEMLCTNGMSNYLRDEINANSGIIVNVNQENYGKELFSGLNYQRELENLAFKLGGSNYRAPVQNVEDFINDKVSKKLVLEPSFATGYTSANLREIFPTEIYENLVAGLQQFDKRIPGFIAEGVITGVETRSSAPLRILRNENSQSISANNLYPIGEGAGYTGGIVSSAIDGIKVAEQLFAQYLTER